MDKKREELLIEAAGYLGYAEGKKQIKFESSKHFQDMARSIATQAGRILEQDDDKHYIAVVYRLVQGQIAAQELAGKLNDHNDKLKGADVSE